MHISNTARRYLIKDFCFAHFRDTKINNDFHTNNSFPSVLIFSYEINIYRNLYRVAADVFLFFL